MPNQPQANDLFARAYELSGEARETYLAEACGDDAELHLRVQGLLASALKADSFFGDTDGATIGAEEFGETHSEQEGDQVGPYILRQKIGEGGFGLVWMAEQRDLRRGAADDSRRDPAQAQRQARGIACAIRTSPRGSSSGRPTSPSAPAIPAAARWT